MLVPSFCGINCFLGLPLFILHWPTALYRSSRAQHPMADQCKGHYFPPFGGGRCPRYLASGVENMGSGMGKHDRYRRTPLLGFIVDFFSIFMSYNSGHLSTPEPTVLLSPGRDHRCTPHAGLKKTRKGRQSEPVMEATESAWLCEVLCQHPPPNYQQHQQHTTDQPQTPQTKGQLERDRGR